MDAVGPAEIEHRFDLIDELSEDEAAFLYGALVAAVSPAQWDACWSTLSGVWRLSRRSVRLVTDEPSPDAPR